MFHAARFDDLHAVIRRAIRRPGFPSAIRPRVRAVTLVLLTAMLSPLATWAQEQPTAVRGGLQWGAGLGVGTIREPYQGVDDETIGIPILFLENRWLSIGGPGVDLKLPLASPIAFRLRARYEPRAGYEADDSPALSGMEERKPGVWVGAAALWHSEIVDVGADWLVDASGYSEGQRATVSLQRRFPFGAFSATPRIEGIWLDRKNVNYYYGVATQEARAGRPFYDADSTVNTRFGVRFDYRPEARHVLFLDLSATQLGAEIADSPIVEQSSYSSVFLGYVYMFRTGRPD